MKKNKEKRVRCSICQELPALKKGECVWAINPYSRQKWPKTAVIDDVIFYDEDSYEEDGDCHGFLVKFIGDDERGEEIVGLSKDHAFIPRTPGVA